MSLTELEKQMFTNGTFDINILEEVINIIRINSFKYLYPAQRELVGYKRFDLKITELISMNPSKDKALYPKKYSKNVAFEFIPIQNKRVYKNSEFFTKEISIFDISTNINIFTYTFMVFIDGKFFDSATILSEDDTTYLILTIDTNKMTDAYFNTLLSRDVDITLIFVPNCLYNVYNTNNFLLQQYTNYLSLPELGLSESLNSLQNYINYVNLSDLKFSSIILDSVKSAPLLRFYDNTQLTFDNKYAHLNIFGLIHLINKIDIIGTDEYFQVPIQNMPVPVENILIFKNVDGVKYFAHEISLEMFYPHIYKIIGNTDSHDLTILVLYSDDNPNNTSLAFQNELALYYESTSDILSKYKDSTIPNIIKEFNPMEFIYSINDFKETLADEPLSYKIEKFQEWCSENSAILRAYLERLLTNGSGYYLDVSTIDLESRYRIDTSTEISEIYPVYTFPDPRYLFILTGGDDADLSGYRFFIDGSLYIPDMIFKDDSYSYYYFPTSLVTPTSIIEVEKFEKFEFSIDIIFHYIDEKVSISLPTTTMGVYVHDIFIVNKTLNNEYVDMSLFNFAIQKDGEILDVPSTSSINLRDFKIGITDPNLVEQHLTLYINKVPFFHVCDEANTDGLFPILSFSSNEIINRDKDNFRVFRNYKLLPENFYTIIFPTNLAEDYTVTSSITMTDDDIYVIEYVPIKYRQIWYQKTIPATGYLDLQGIITRPFDLDWYFVYLNGARLNKNNINIISPTKIFIKNVDSLKHLTILERYVADDLFNIGPNPSSPSDMIWDTVPELRTTVISSQPLIRNIVADIITQIIDTSSSELFGFYSQIMNNNMFINPDETVNFSNDTLQRYPSIFTPDIILVINPDDGAESELIMPIFPQIV